MITLRPSNTLGVLQTPTLESLRSFSNNSYYNPAFLGINELAVINDDTQQAGGTVPMHQHANLEIVSYHVIGSSRHVDTLGNDVVDTLGNVYLMSAGNGLAHSETNANNGPTRYLQIWFKPNQKNTIPTFVREQVTAEQKTNNFRLLASNTGPLVMKTDTAKLYAGIFNQDFTQPLDATKTYYLYVVNGSVAANGHTLQMRDAIKIDHETQLNLTLANCEMLFFEL